MTTSQHYQVSDEAYSAFENDGAVVLRGVVDESWVHRLRTAIDRNMQSDKWYFHYIYMWQHDPDLADYCFHSPVPGVASQLFRTDKVNLLYDQIFVKDTGTSERTDWHNDLPYWPVRGPAMSIWLALDVVEQDTGALEFIRGSHKWNRWFEVEAPPGTEEPHEQDPSFEPMPDFEAERERHEMLSWNLMPGDVVAFHALTVHGAHANRREGYRRRGYALRFAAGEAAYHRGPGALPRFCNASMRHGQALDSEQYPVVFGA